MNEFENTPVVTPRQLGEKVLFGELEKRVKELETRIDALAMGDTQPALHAGLEELEERVAHLENETLPDDTVTQLEAKVESLTRTLDLLQEVLGVEIVASPLEEVEL